MNVKIVKYRSFWSGRYKLKVDIVGAEYQVDEIQKEIVEVILKYTKGIKNLYIEG